MTARDFWKFALILYVVSTVGFFLWAFFTGWPISPKRYLINSWPLYVIPVIGLLWKKER